MFHSNLEAFAFLWTLSAAGIAVIAALAVAFVIVFAK